MSRKGIISRWRGKKVSTKEHLASRNTRGRKTVSVATCVMVRRARQPSMTFMGIMDLDRTKVRDFCWQSESAIHAIFSYRFGLAKEHTPIYFKHCYIMYSRAMEWTYCYSSSCGEVHQLSKLIFSEGKYMWIYTNKPGEQMHSCNSGQDKAQFTLRIIIHILEANQNQQQQ